MSLIETCFYSRLYGTLKLDTYTCFYGIFQNSAQETYSSFWLKIWIQEQVRHFFLGFGSNPVRGFHFHRIQLRIFWIKIELKIIFRISVLTPELRILKISKGDSNIIWVARRRTFPLHYVAIKNDVFIFSEIATLDLENTG